MDTSTPVAADSEAAGPDATASKDGDITPEAAKSSVPSVANSRKPADQPANKHEAPKTPGATDADARSRTDETAAPGTDVVTTVPPDRAKRGPGFVPLVLGGLVAGAVGYAVPTFLMPPPEADTARLEALEARVEEMPGGTEPVDLSAVEASQETLSMRLDDVAARLDAIESAAAEPDAPPPAPVDLEPLRAELSDVAGAVDGLRADLEPRIASVEGGLTDALSRAENVEDEAEALARETARNQITVALQSGAAFSESLGVLDDAPEALASVADTGVATSAELVAAFPPLAREALRVSRDAEPAAGVGSLFRNAFNARSLEPREGGDPDAVLSRAEAAVRAGELDIALNEIAALPEDARATLSDWMGRAQARADALTAARDFLKDG